MVTDPLLLVLVLGGFIVEFQNLKLVNHLVVSFQHE